MNNVGSNRSFIREHAWSLVLAALLHVAIVGFLLAGYLHFKSPPKPVQPQQLAIQGTVVDEKQIAAESRRLDEEAQQKEQRQREELEKTEQLKREREAEEQRLEEVKKQRAEQQEAEELERKKAAELEIKRKAEEEAKAAVERKRKAEEEAKLAAERKRKEDEQRRKAAAEAKQRAEREAELKRQMGEEERRNAAVNSGLLAQYIAQIQARVQRAWNRPPSAKEGLNCIVHVTQVPGGQVVGVRVGECNGDEIVRQSIEAAVYRASPLPEPPDPALFERNLVLNFRPTEQ